MTAKIILSIVSIRNQNDRKIHFCVRGLLNRRRVVSMAEPSPFPKSGHQRPTSYHTTELQRDSNVLRVFTVWSVLFHYPHTQIGVRRVFTGSFNIRRIRIHKYGNIQKMGTENGCNGYIVGRSSVCRGNPNDVFFFFERLELTM